MPPAKAPARPPGGGIAAHCFKHHPGQQQVDLSVRIDVPGSWFSAGADGTLTAAEKKDKYVAVASEYEEKHVFEPSVGRRPAKVGQGIRFVCPEDAATDPSHAGFWMPLASWNRYRHDTYKGQPEAEVCERASVSFARSCS